MCFETINYYYSSSAPLLQITARLCTAGKSPDGVKFFVPELVVHALKLPEEAKLVRKRVYTRCRVFRYDSIS